MWWEALWRLVGVLTDAGPTALLFGAGAIAGVLLLAVLTATVLLGHRAAAAPSGLDRAAQRERARRTGVPRHRDPDAPGRTRPRGPTRLPVAA